MTALQILEHGIYDDTYIDLLPSYVPDFQTQPHVTLLPNGTPNSHKHYKH